MRRSTRRLRQRSSQWTRTVHSLSTECSHLQERRILWPQTPLPTLPSGFLASGASSHQNASHANILDGDMLRIAHGGQNLGVPHITFLSYLASLAT